VIVVVTAEAESDLERITTYIAEQSPKIALNFVRELREKCESWLMRRAAIHWCHVTNTLVSVGDLSVII
jgi:plasmid stabilization system protein ParE